ncbi:MAG: DNA alkylation repair protein [Muribaculaceae bacterium]|nr:DNA alkylation repair protein [Muribaculaceae bacterium]
MMKTEKALEIEELMTGMGDDAQARHLMRFFKCAPGEYGYGDRFLGIRCPETRRIVKECRKVVDIDTAVCLVKSEWHEIRLAGFLLLIEIYKMALKSKDERRAEEIVKLYLDLIPYGNNWDLVDMVAPKILGEHILRHPEDSKILDFLSERTDSLWHQRVAIVSTWTLIRGGRYDEALRISEKYLSHTHDLIHKATGWMIREIGKRGARDLQLEFLDKFTPVMPRTALRYAIEHLPESQRRHYLSIPRER